MTCRSISLRLLRLQGEKPRRRKTTSYLSMTSSTPSSAAEKGVTRLRDTSPRSVNTAIGLRTSHSTFHNGFRAYGSLPYHLSEVTCVTASESPNRAVIQSINACLAGEDSVGLTSINA